MPDLRQQSIPGLVPGGPVNRPHYHVWNLASTGRAFFRLTRGFHTRQAARQYAKRRQSDSSQFMVLECRNPGCRPKLD